MIFKKRLLNLKIKRILITKKIKIIMNLKI